MKRGLIVFGVWLAAVLITAAIAHSGTKRDNIVNCLSDRAMTVTLQPLTIHGRRVHVLVFASVTSKTGLYLQMAQKRCYPSGGTPEWAR